MPTEFLVPWSELETAEAKRLPRVWQMEYRRRSVEWVRDAYDKQLAAGLDRFGQKLAPIDPRTAKARQDNINSWSGKAPYSPMGRAEASNPPLQATGEDSRTRAWMRCEQTDAGVRVWWINGWGEILGYHATGYVTYFRYPQPGWGKVPARDLFGLAPPFLQDVQTDGLFWIQNGHRSLLEGPGPRPFEEPAQSIDLDRATFGIGASRRTVRRARQAGTSSGLRQSVHAAPIGPKRGEPRRSPPPEPVRSGPGRSHSALRVAATVEDLGRLAGALNWLKGILGL